MICCIRKTKKEHNKKKIKKQSKLPDESLPSSGLLAKKRGIINPAREKQLKKSHKREEKKLNFVKLPKRQPKHKTSKSSAKGGLNIDLAFTLGLNKNDDLSRVKLCVYTNNHQNPKSSQISDKLRKDEEESVQIKMIPQGHSVSSNLSGMAKEPIFQKERPEARKKKAPSPRLNILYASSRSLEESQPSIGEEVNPLPSRDNSNGLMIPALGVSFSDARKLRLKRSFTEKDDIIPSPRSSGLEVMAPSNLPNIIPALDSNENLKGSLPHSSTNPIILLNDQKKPSSLQKHTTTRKTNISGASRFKSCRNYIKKTLLQNSIRGRSRSINNPAGDDPERQTINSAKILEERCLDSVVTKKKTNLMSSSKLIDNSVNQFGLSKKFTSSNFRSPPSAMNSQVQNRVVLKHRNSQTGVLGNLSQRNRAGSRDLHDSVPRKSFAHGSVTPPPNMKSNFGSEHQKGSIDLRNSAKKESGITVNKRRPHQNTKNKRVGVRRQQTYNQRVSSAAIRSISYNFNSAHRQKTNNNNNNSNSHRLVFNHNKSIRRGSMTQTIKSGVSRFDRKHQSISPDKNLAVRMNLRSIEEQQLKQLLRRNHLNSKQYSKTPVLVPQKRPINVNRRRPSNLSKLVKKSNSKPVSVKENGAYNYEKHQSMSFFYQNQLKPSSFANKQNSKTPVPSNVQVSGGVRVNRKWASHVNTIEKELALSRFNTPDNQNYKNHNKSKQSQRGGAKNNQNLEKARHIDLFQQKFNSDNELDVSTRKLFNDDSLSSSGLNSSSSNESAQEKERTNQKFDQTQYFAGGLESSVTGSSSSSSITENYNLDNMIGVIDRRRRNSILTGEKKAENSKSILFKYDPNEHNYMHFHNLEKVKGFEFVREIGHGSFARVLEMIDEATKTHYAVKVMSKAKFNAMMKCKNLDLDIKHEVKFISEFNHPNLIFVEKVIETKKSVNIVMPLIKSGALFGKRFWRSVNKKNKAPKGTKNLDIPDIKFFFRQIVAGVNELYKVAHRDLKPDNILVDKFFRVKVIDFGISESFKDKEDDTSQSRLGTICYHPPEVYDPDVKTLSAYACDMWALGCILFQLVTGKLPFKGKNERGTIKQIQAAKFELDDNIDPDLKRLIEMMLVKDPAKRVKIGVVSEDEWLQKCEE